MKRRLWSFGWPHPLLLGFLVLVLSATGGQAARAFQATDAAKAEFQAADCWNPLKGHAPADCGWLVVPERWDRVTEKKLKLPVVIFQPRDPDPSLEPVIYLSGGPGNSALGAVGAHIPSWRVAADYLFPGRKVLVFDQRGTGLGQPRLDCPEAKDPAVWWDLSTDPESSIDGTARLHDIIARCHDALLAEGHDLSAFSSRQSAADVEALRALLGAERVVLYGLSYGTRLALTVMRHYPARVAAAVLDSVVPLQVTWPADYGLAYQATLDRLFAACRNRADCAAAYPALERRFLDLLARLKREPVALQIDNLTGREPLYLRLDHLNLLWILRLEMYYKGRIPNLPSVIAGASRGEYWRLRPHAENVIYGPYPRLYDIGMQLSVVCQEGSSPVHGLPERDHGNIPAHLWDFMTRQQNTGLCRAWPSAVWDETKTSPVTSDVPSLLLSGGLDTSTPVEFGNLAAETLTRSYHFVFPANGHVQINRNRCAHELLWAFLASPETRPNPPCLQSLRQPAFLALGGG